MLTTAAPSQSQFSIHFPPPTPTFNIIFHPIPFKEFALFLLSLTQWLSALLSLCPLRSNRLYPSSNYFQSSPSLSSLSYSIFFPSFFTWFTVQLLFPSTSFSTSQLRLTLFLPIPIFKKLLIPGNVHLPRHPGLQCPHPTHIPLRVPGARWARVTLRGPGGWGGGNRGRNE